MTHRTLQVIDSQTGVTKWNGCEAGNNETGSYAE